MREKVKKMCFIISNNEIESKMKASKTYMKRWRDRVKNDIQKWKQMK